MIGVIFPDLVGTADAGLPPTAGLRRWLSVSKPCFPAGGTGNKEAFFLENAMPVVPDALARASAFAGRRTWLYF